MSLVTAPPAGVRRGLTRIVVPERNRADLDDVPADVAALLEFHPSMTIDEVLAVALEPVPQPVGAVRFSEFEQALGPVPPATLAARLADLEAAGLLDRRVVDTRPPRAEYALTAEGRRLAPLLEALTTCTRDRRRR